jgi:hypothetical protein
MRVTISKKNKQHYFASMGDVRSMAETVATDESHWMRIVELKRANRDAAIAAIESEIGPVDGTNHGELKEEDLDDINLNSDFDSLAFALATGKVSALMTVQKHIRR